MARKVTLLLLLVANSSLGQFGTQKDLAFWGKKDRFGTYCDTNTGPYIVQQTFETPVTGYDNGETWTESGDAGTVNPAYTGVVLQGTQSLRINQSGNKAQTITSFSAQDEVYIYFLMRGISGFPDNPTRIGFLNDSSTIGMNVNNSGTLSLCGNVCATTVGTMTAGTTYHVWFHYKKGSGSDQISEAAFSTDGIRPTSGDNYAIISNGTRTSQITSFQFVWDAFNFTQQVIFDKVRISTNCIGSNPP